MLQIYASENDDNVTKTEPNIETLLPPFGAVIEADKKSALTVTIDRSRHPYVRLVARAK